MKNKFIPLILFVWFAFTPYYSESQNWSALGNGFSSGHVFAMAEYNGELYAAGVFTVPGTTNNYNIARWNGAAWANVGTGMDNVVYTLAVYNGELYAGGIFTTAGGVSAVKIAKWNGNQWSKAGPSNNVIGTSSSYSVRALEVYNGELYVGGTFGTQGNLAPAKYIIKFNGSTWSAVSTDSPTANNMTYEGVYTLHSFNNELYVGGKFTTAGGTSANNIAKWNANSSSWSTIGNGLSDFVYCLEEYNGELYVGGNFDSSGTTQLNHIAKLSGTNFLPVGSGVDQKLNVLKTYYGELYAGGYFSNAGSNSASRIASWNGVNWSSPGTGANSTVESFCVFNNELYVGGAFTTAGSLTANRIARWAVVGAGIKDEENNIMMSLYPNPAKGNISVSIDNIEEQVVCIYILNSVGQLVYSEKQPGLKKYSFDLSDQPKGLYLVQLVTQSGAITRKLILD